jgi:hypothetical protein
LFFHPAHKNLTPLRKINLIFSQTDIDAMERVENSKSSEFVDLVKCAGLDPSHDFRFANLRGIDIRGADLKHFDFCGADLSGALVRITTQLPEPDKMDGAKCDFDIVEDRPEIVEMMQAIEASNPSVRKTLLSKLSVDYDSDRHIDVFVLNQLKKYTNSYEAADLLGFMTPEFLIENEASISKVLSKIINKDTNRRTPRKKVGAVHARDGISRLVKGVADSDMPTASEVCNRYRSGDMTISLLVSELDRVGMRSLF